MSKRSSFSPLDIQMDNDVKATYQDIKTVADNVDVVSTVSSNITDIQNVNANISNIDAVTNDLTNINDVAGDLTNIDAVNSNKTNIDTVATSIININTVGTDIVKVHNYYDTYLGEGTTEPTTRRDDSALQHGDLFFNTTLDEMRVYDGSVWKSGYHTNTVDLDSVQTIIGQKTFAQPLKVADAVNTDEALNKGQLLTEIKAVDGAGSGIDADTVDGVQGALLGIGGAGYAWGNETANRTAGTTYTNTTGKPIVVSIRCGNNTAITLTVDGIGVSRKDESSATTLTRTLQAIVSSDSTYSISSCDIYSWSELK